MPQQKYNKLAGKHVLVIGGTSGIGFCVAEASLESGASVTVSSSSASRVESAIEKLKTSYPGSKVAGYACDLSKPSLEQDIEALFKQVGKVDHIVFTAGDKLVAMPLQEVTLEKIHLAGQIRFAAPILVAKVGSRYLEKSSNSSITLTTGAVAERPMPNWSVVCGYAAGGEGLTRNLAIDLKPIRVNAVSPGGLMTELWEGMDSEQKEKMFKSWAEHHPTGHAGTPEEVAEAYLWLMKDSNVTGRIAASDSGALLV